MADETGRWAEVTPDCRVMDVALPGTMQSHVLVQLKLYPAEMTEICTLIRQEKVADAREFIKRKLPKVELALDTIINALVKENESRKKALSHPENPRKVAAARLGHMGDELLDKMQKPGQREAMKEAFDASPEEMGEAARSPRALDKTIVKQYYVRCTYCGKRCSNDMPIDIIVRAVVECPECAEDNETDEERFAREKRSQRS